MKSKHLIAASLAAFFLFINPIAAMADEIFFKSKNAVSGRTAIFEDDGQVAYLYLTLPSSMSFERDVILYMRRQPITRAEFADIMASQSTPMLTIDIASANAVIQDPKESDFAFIWSRDGNSVGILYHDQPLAFTSATERLGYSKAVVATSPFANIWEQVTYDTIFNK